jgi:hypothetical protein
LFYRMWPLGLEMRLARSFSIGKNPAPTTVTN